MQGSVACTLPALLRSNLPARRTCCRCGGVASWAAMASGVPGTLAAMPTGAPTSAEGAGSAAARIWPSATLAAWNASVCTRSTAARQGWADGGGGGLGRLMG